MLIYLAFLIPLAATIFLLIKFPHKTAWWEYLLNFGVPAVLIVLAKVISTTSQTATPEVWNNYVVSATYYEYWNEWITKTCYNTCYDECEDANGGTYSCNPHDCNPYDCSYQENHPPYWEAMDNQGHTFRITQKDFLELCMLWKNKKFIDMDRDYHTVDGDAYSTVSDSFFDHTVARTTQHSYENRVKCSRSVFNFAKVDSGDIADFGLFKYPLISEFNYNPILGWDNPQASMRLQRYNARIGSFRQVHMMILIFKDKPVQAAILQEGLWKGGNKNEFILCVGVRNNAISWAKVISWTEADELKIGVEKTVSNMPFDLIKISDYMAGEVQKKFVRKQFKDFSYITVEPTDKAILITFILTLVCSIGLGIFVVKNPWDN